MILFACIIITINLNALRCIYIIMLIATSMANIQVTLIKKKQIKKYFLLSPRQSIILKWTNVEME